MATWVTHLMIADQIMKEAKGLDRHGFCVGNIAPDCNVENEDWTSFIPPREVTHWMHGNGKDISDSDLFYEKYIRKHADQVKTEEHYAFLLGYYTHLVTDAVFQKFIRDKNRVKAVWNRIKMDGYWGEIAKEYPEDWSSVRKLIPHNIRMNEIYTMEAEYLREHPDSGYLTEIITLKDFPDYIDYLPQGCIARKVRIMGRMPEIDANVVNPVTISREELHSFVDDTAELWYYVSSKKRQYKVEYSISIGRYQNKMIF